jgi:hypothetical protein
VRLENPLASDCSYEAKVSNRRNFGTDPQEITLGPYEARDVAVVYRASALNQVEEGSVVFTHPEAGDWEFLVSGTGSVPTQMEALDVVASLGQNTSALLLFRNPLPKMMVVDVEFETTEPAETFTLLLKKATGVQIAPFKELHIPFFFVPNRMAEHHGHVKVMCADPAITWNYPVVGVAEAPALGLVATYSCPSRNRVDEVLEVTLPGLQPEDMQGLVTFTLKPPDQKHAQALAKSVNISLLTSTPQPPEGKLRFAVGFSPMLPFHSLLGLVVKKEGGGRWRFDVQFDATEPEIDDIITVEGVLGSVSTVSFRLTNNVLSPAKFVAFFTPDTPNQLTVMPSQGVLDPYGSDGSIFTISFAPSEYGKPMIGKLLIQTSDMQWTYEVRGVHPAYVAPTAKSKVDSHLGRQTENALDTRNKRNYLKDNAKFPAARK